MHALTGILVPLIVVIAVALIVWWVAERFSPDPLITKIVQVIVFVVVLIWCLTKLLPLLVAGAHAHEFYYLGCCGERDCRPVPCAEVHEDAGVYEYDGMMTRPSAQVSWIVFASPDGRCHVCVGRMWEGRIMMPYLRCLYLPRYLS